jgi:hypothetical protein
MIKPHEIRADITGRDLRLILEKNNLTQFINNGEIIESIDWSHVVFQKMGLRPEFLKTVISAFKEVILFLRKTGNTDPELEIFMQDLENILLSFDEFWSPKTGAFLQQYLIDNEKADSFFATLENACFLIFIKKHLGKFENNRIAALISVFLKNCENWKDKQFAWLYTRNELMQCRSLTLNGRGRANKFGIQLDEDVMKLLLEKQAVLDSVVFAMLPLLTISEKQLRQDIHGWVQAGLKIILSDELPSFDYPWSYYFIKGSPKRKVNKAIYVLLQNFYELPADWESYEKLSKEKVSSKVEFEDLIQKKITRCFKKKVGQKR